MSDNSADKKRIVKNTILLYGRMLLMMVISLYTSRVILNALGVEDYGIYNVVGGVVTMFTMLSGSLSAAISRFITFELGKGDPEKLKRVFATSVNVQLILIVIITILLETIGLWFLNNKLVIPEDRLVAANWVFQFSVITFAINLWSVPYNAAIIAHEHMNAFAYISIFDAVAKLFVAFAILKNPCDRLIYYSALLLVVGIIQRYLYAFYCKRHFAECEFYFLYDKKITKEIFGFAGWNFIGASSDILRDQGGNILINLFFGPTINAARGIAIQVNGAVYSFVQNFMTAIKPQITKNYASGNWGYMMELLFLGCRYGYYILLLLSLPVIINAEYILALWLGQVPEHTASFVRLVLLFSLSESLSSTLITAQLATGKIKNYQLIVGTLSLLNLPLSYLCLKLGAPAECIFVVAIFVSLICELARVLMLRKMINLSVRAFLYNVLVNVALVTIVASIVPVYLSMQFDFSKSFSMFLLSCFITLVCCFLSIVFVGCSKGERAYAIKIIDNLVKKIRR